jgi:hypothetical protein
VDELLLCRDDNVLTGERFRAEHPIGLSHRDIEDLLAEREMDVGYESIRFWCRKFAPKYVKRLRRKHQGFGDTLSTPGAEFRHAIPLRSLLPRCATKLGINRRAI